MVCKAFAVLTAIVKTGRQAQMFADPNALSTMCERIALPNIAMRSKLVLTVTATHLLTMICYNSSCRRGIV